MSGKKSDTYEQKAWDLRVSKIPGILKSDILISGTILNWMVILLKISLILAIAKGALDDIWLVACL